MKKYNIIYLLFLSFIIANDIDVLNLKNGDVIKGEIKENKINEYIKIELQGGSILTYTYDQIESIEKEKVTTRTFGSNPSNNQSVIQTSPIRNCYQDGYNSGQQVSGGGAMIGGLGGGFLLGLIGWGISYIVVAGGNPQPEYYEIQSLDANCQNEFSNGYKQGALKVKKSNVNIGGAIGTLTIVMIMSSSY